MVDTTALLLAPIAFVALGLATVFVSASAAFSRLREDRIERLVQRRAEGARRLASLADSRESLEMALLIVRATATATFAIIAYAVVLRLTPAGWFEAPLGIAVAMGGVVLAQAAGGVWGAADPEQTALKLAPIGSVSLAILRGPANALLALYRPLRRRLPRRRKGSAAGSNGQDASGAGVTTVAEAPFDTDEELERRISRGVLNLESMAVREIMVPRPDIVGISTDDDLDGAVEMVNSAGFSRLPLYHETLDDVRGVLYAKDLLAAMHRTPENGNGLESLARAAYLIPETKRLGDLLRDFQQRRVHIALVVDEYGSIVGLVTNEDVLEELVGEIDDEFTASEQLIESRGPGEAIVDARAPLKWVGETFGIEFEAEGFDTLGGLIFHKLGRIPTAGETVTEDGVTLKVLSTAGRRIRRVQVTSAAAADGDPQSKREPAA